MNLEQRVRLGYGYLEYLGEHEPEYFVTLTYRYRYCDQIAEDGMRAFVRKLVTRMPRGARRSLGGLVCAERHTEAKFAGAYHFHLLLWGLDEVMSDAQGWLEGAVVRAASELHPRNAGPGCDCADAKRLKRKKTCRGGMACRGPQMSGVKWVNVQRVEQNPAVVDEYLIDDIYGLDKPTGAQLLDVGPDGVTGRLID